MRGYSRLLVLKKGKNSRIAVSHFGGNIETPKLVDKVYEKKSNLL